MSQHWLTRALDIVDYLYQICFLLGFWNTILSLPSFDSLAVPSQSHVLIFLISQTSKHWNVISHRSLFLIPRISDPVYGFKYHSYTNNSQIYTFGYHLISRLMTHKCNCQFNIFIRCLIWNIKLIMSITKFLSPAPKLLILLLLYLIKLLLNTISFSDQNFGIIFYFSSFSYFMFTPFANNSTPKNISRIWLFLTTSIVSTRVQATLISPWIISVPPYWSLLLSLHSPWSTPNTAARMSPLKHTLYHGT